MSRRRTWQYALCLLGVLFVVWLASTVRAQSWQAQPKRGTKNGTPGDYVSYADLDAAITALQQYENMLEVQYSEVKTKQEDVLRRLTVLEPKVDEIKAIKADVEEMKWQHHAILGGVVLNILSTAVILVLFKRNGRKGNGNGV